MGATSGTRTGYPSVILGFTPEEHLGLPPIACGARIAESLVYCVFYFSVFDILTLEDVNSLLFDSSLKYRANRQKN
jgi:hypothetical protein